ncbi:MAG: FUSC family protein [Candidatus Nanopelagicales bacterium]|jgi:hypothetical protein
MMAKASRGQRILLIGLLTIALMAPPTLLIISGQPGLASLFVYGGAIGMAAIFYDLRLAVAVSFAAGAAGVVAASLSSSPLPGAIFFGLLTGGCALTARRGLHSPVLMIPVFISFVLVAPPRLADASLLVSNIVVGVVLALGGLWLTLVARILFGRPTGMSDRQRFSTAASVGYGLVMGIVLGIAAWVVLTEAKFHQGAWLLLTLIMVMQPSPHDTLTKSLQRLGGTLTGGAVAFILILLGLGTPYSFLVGGLLLFAAFVLRFALKRPYWEFVGALTPAIILLDAQGGDGIKIAEDRVVFTAIAVVVAILIALSVKALLLWKAPQAESA